MCSVFSGSSEVASVMFCCFLYERGGVKLMKEESFYLGSEEVVHVLHRGQ